MKFGIQKFGNLPDQFQSGVLVVLSGMSVYYTVIVFWVRAQHARLYEDEPDD